MLIADLLKCSLCSSAENSPPRQRQHEDETIVTLTVNGEEIETTPWHLFYTNEGWVEAGELEAGDLLLSLGGVYGEVEAILTEDRTETMYDLTADEVHTFAVGDGDWVVHNQNSQTWNCINPTYALGNLGNPNDVLVANTLALNRLYKPRRTTVFSAVYDLGTGRWIAQPSEGALLANGRIPYVGFDVLREGGHKMVWLDWRSFDDQIATTLGEQRQAGFTLVYFSDIELGIRWTSRSMNFPNWLSDYVPVSYVPGHQIKAGMVPLQADIIQSVQAATNLSVVDLPAGLLMDKPNRR